MRSDSVWKLDSTDILERLATSRSHRKGCAVAHRLHRRHDARVDPGAVPWKNVWGRALLATLLGALWVSLFWLQPARQWPLWSDFYRFMDGLLFDVTGQKGTWRWVIKSYLMVLAPIGFLWIFGKPPTALGLGRMADKGWRIVAVGFAISLPVLIWLGLRPGIQSYYASMFTKTGYSPMLANMLVIVVEHAFIEGLLLSFALPGGTFAHGPEPERQGRFAWLGFGCPEGQRGFLAWIGIPPKVVPALVGQALVFGMVHAGKEVGELVTAFPGGLGLGALTYRIRSVWPSVLLHVGTGAVILATAWLAR
jgi:hypothetical protein